MKTALITGAARGIGRAIAENLARDHAVAITHHTTDPGSLLQACPDIKAFPLDLGDPDAIAALPAQVMDAFGRLDIIVHNAAVIATDTTENLDPAAAATQYAVNVTAPMALTSAALPHLAPGSAVLNISSQNARLPSMGAQSYSASKAALESWTRIAAKTLGAKGIRVNAVAPGAVNTPEAPRSAELTDIFLQDTALQDLATPEDIAEAVRFLVSDAARAITGEVLTVSGGYRL